MTESQNADYYLDASAFFARHPHLNKQDPRFEYACDRREYVESLAAPSVEATAVLPPPPASSPLAAEPQTAAERAWDRAIAAHNAKGQPPVAGPFASPRAANARKAAPPGDGASDEAAHPAWRWAMRQHGGAVR